MALNRGDHPKRNDRKRVASIRKSSEPQAKLVVKKRLQGKSQRQIAKEITAETGKSLTHQRVNILLHREDVQAMLEKEYLKLAAAVPMATDNIIEAAQSFEVGGEDASNKIPWEANKLIAQAHGIIPTAQQSIVHQTFIENQTNNIIPPFIAELAAKHFNGYMKVIEHEPVSNNAGSPSDSGGETPGNTENA